MDQEATAVIEHPVLAGLRAANDDLDKACRSELWQALDDDVETALAGVLAAEARLSALRGLLVREADARGLRARSQALSTAGWLQDRFRLSRSRAGRVVDEATDLGRHPQVEVALAGAALSPDHARIATKALDRAAGLPALSERDLEAAAELLIEQAAVLDPRRLTTAAEQLLEALAARAPSVDYPAEADEVRKQEQAAEDAARRAGANRLRVRRRPDGGAKGNFDFGPLGAAALVDWLTCADRPHPGTDGFEDTRNLDERRGDALVDAMVNHLDADGAENLPLALTDDSHPSLPGTGTDGPTARYRNDPSVHPQRLSARSDDTRRITRRRPGARIGVTIGLDALRAGLTGAGRLDTGGTLSAAELRRLACDAQLIPIVLGGDSQILDVGRATRAWNLAQERGIYARDWACVAPGCDRPPAACQIHHRWEWAKGGPTDVANGALLCLFHHQQVHRQGWKVTMAANGYPQLIPPASIDPERRPRQHHRFRLTLLTGRRRS